MIALALLASFSPIEGVLVSCAENVRGKEGRARVEVVVAAGALAERVPGEAHLLEHLVLRPLGYDDSNGTTSWDATSYFRDVRASELSTAAIDLLRLIRSPRFGPEEVEIERKIVLRELGERAAGALDLFADTQFERPIGGDADSLAGATPESLRAFHAAHYTRPNLALVLLGAVSCAALGAALAPELAAFPDGEKTPVARETARPNGPQRLPPGPRTFLAGFFWYDAGPEERLVYRLLAHHLKHRAFTELRDRLGVTYSPALVLHELARGGVAAVHVEAAGELDTVAAWYEGVLADLEGPAPLERLRPSIDPLRRELEIPGVSHALAALRGEPSPLSILDGLDAPRLDVLLPELLAPSRRFGTSSRSIAEPIVLALTAIAVLGFLAWLGRQLLRAG